MMSNHLRQQFRMIHNDLITLGLTKTEATIYIWLLDFGSAKPAQITVGTGLKRTTVYSAIQEMLKKGIVIIEGVARSTTVSAQPPHVLQNIVEAEHQKIQQKKIASQRIIQQLQTKEVMLEYLNKQYVDTIDDVTTYITQRVDTHMHEEQITQVMGWAYDDIRTTIPFITILKDVVTATGIQTPIKILSYGTYPDDHISNEPPLHIKKWNGKELSPTNSLIMGSVVLHIERKKGAYHITELMDETIVSQLRSLWSVLWDINSPSAFREFSL